MTTNPLISIVLPTYNGSRYLAESIQSCLDQTYQNWELIIVDDASTDETPSIIAQFVNADRRIRSVRHDTNRKLPAALNTGFAQAKGNYLTWTSDDNRYRPAALATMVTFLESNPDVNVVYSDCTAIDEAGQILYIVKSQPVDRLVLFNCVGFCFLYQRQVAEKIGNYSEDLVLAEDYDFWLRASVYFQLAPLHQDLYICRLHPDSLTVSQKQGVIAATEKTLAERLPELHWVGNGMRARGYIRLSDLASARKDSKLVGRYILYAMRYDPILTLLIIGNKKFGLRGVRYYWRMKYKNIELV